VDPSFRRPYLWLCALFTLYSALFIAYSQTWAFTFDEGYHMLAAQLIGDGRTPYLDFCFPQTPLNAYWNAFLLRTVAENWHVTHLFATLFTIAAIALLADYTFRRFPVSEWRFAVTLAVLGMFSLNAPIVVYGPVQAYGICLLGLASAFRFAVRAVDRPSPMFAALTGGFASVAAASSLLTFAASPVLLLWMLVYNRAGSRVRKFAAFAAGAAIPFAPVWWLFARGFSETWFNLFRYHAFFRKLYWPETTQHDLEILTSWIDSGQALLLGLLAIAGLLFVIRRSQWPHAFKAECYLCASLALVIAATVGRAHPTFSRYFLFTTPFLAILAAAGLYAIASRVLDAPRPLWPAWLLVFLFALGLGKTLYERSTNDNWATFERIAAKIDKVTPRGAPLFADEPIFFLTHRTPPSGYELSYTHKVVLPPAEGARMHILTEAQVKAQVQSGMFATAYTCDDDDATSYGLKDLYREHATVETCQIFWNLVKH
jgi:hypothetical protein